MRLINSYSLEFQEFENGSCPPYAILSHTWGGEEILYRDMLWIQDFRRTHESDSLSSHERGKLQDGSTDPPTNDPAAPGPAARSLPVEDEECPPYEEVEESSTEDQSTARSLRARHGYQKILNIAEHCRVSQIGYFWIDTCCIDKTSSLEVTEAVLSAYRWYRDATVCFMYLADVPPTDVLHDRDSVFRRSWWFTRGWTLIELIAPTARVWFDQDWNFIFPETPLISEITGIDEPYLESASPTFACVAKRMSWAAHRSTTRQEDVAYCLMGLFDVSMQVLYGEGPQNAFMRLQRKILKTTVDPSIFVWGYDTPILDDSARLLATSPDDFAGCRTMRRVRHAMYPLNDHFLLGPRGLELKTDIAQFNRRERIMDGLFGVVLSEIYDETAPDHRIVLPVSSVGAAALAETARVILRRYPGTRPLRIASKARARLHPVSLRSFYFRGEEPGNHVINVLFTPSLSTLPFKLVEVFPPQTLVPSSGGFVSPGSKNMTTVMPNVIFLRYEEQAASPTQPGRRRFVVVLEYYGTRERNSPFEMKKSAVRVVNVTNSNLVSFVDTFIPTPEKAKPHVWSRYLSSVPVGDTLVTAGVETDSERWDLMRLRVRTTPLGSAPDGIVSSDALVGFTGARPEGERLKTPFD